MAVKLAKKKTKGKRKPKCSAPSVVAKSKRLFKYDQKLGCMVEVDRATGETKPVEETGNDDWLRPRMKNCRSQNQSLYPLVSHSLTFHPDQLPEVNKILERNGVKGTNFTAMGQTVFNDETHQTQVCRALKRCNLDPGYRSAAPLHYDGPTYR